VEVVHPQSQSVGVFLHAMYAVRKDSGAPSNAATRVQTAQAQQQDP
jgi:hypothetical protein